jgi:signal transduction histidine kinase/ligand-binding sensor domain-containing protein
MLKTFSWSQMVFLTRNFLFKRVLFISLFLFQIIFPSLLHAQNGTVQNTENKYRAHHWGVEDGLSQGTVYDMIKDQNGFLWIGTQHGLNRFDGSSFKKYLADKTGKNKTIRGNTINGLIEDSLHNIWIGTDKGLSRYDIKADTFTHFASADPRQSSIPFWATKDEVFYWDYPESQLAAYNIHTFSKRQLAKIATADSVGFGVSDHYPVFDKGSNSIWLERGFGNPGGGLFQISLTTGEKKEYTWPCFKKIPNHGHGSEGMRYDRRRNSIWINNADGLLEFMLKDKQIHHVDALKDFEKLKDFWLWAGIDIDAQGRIWEGTSKGMIVYNPADQSVHLLFSNDSVLQKNVTEANVLIYCDRDGMVWSGTWSSKGIYQVIPFSQALTHYVSNPKQPHSLSTDFVFNCSDGGRGGIWMSTDNGINIFDEQTGLIQGILKKDLQCSNGEGKGIAIACIDTTSQKAWVNAQDLFKMDLATRQCIPVIFKDINGKRIPLLTGGFPTPYQKTCILTTNYGGLQEIFIVNPDSTVAEQILSFPDGTLDFFKTATDDHFIFLRQPDSTVNLTYSLIGRKWIRIPNPLDSIPWTKIIFNKADQTYWLATEKTLNHYNKNFSLIQVYSQQDGLPELAICGMIPDKNNNLWFNTESSIHQLDIISGRVTMLSEKDGFQKQNFTSMLNFGKSASGDLYLPGGVFGTGFNRINPSWYVKTTSAVYLQSLLVNEKPVLLPTGINNLKELPLSYSENMITIETGILDFYSGGNNHIRYKLGEKADWQYPLNSARYTIHYEDLAPGNYTLVMQASNASNEFIGPEKILLIRISPPWWQTGWARLLFGLAFVFVLWNFIQYRSRSLKQRNAELEEKVMHRTMELKHSLEDLRATQTQLIQREKMASLGELTAGIAHEIQNPLNFVNNFSDINSELIDEMKQEIKSGNLEEGLHVADIVKENNLKINNHGKRADSIVKGMLLHSRQNAGQFELTNVNVLADEYLRLSYHGLRAKDKSFNATILTDFDPTIEKISIVPQDIGRVLLNLFNNAFYAVAEKKKIISESLPAAASGEMGYEPTISASTKKMDDLVEIRIKDNGMGIPNKLLDKIFQPFFTTKPTGEGTGLGLSLSYEIITKGHGGTIEVDTKEKEFTEFIIRIPQINHSTKQPNADLT